tara:strand:+ start:577 stop:906 length:330 start_codon:yes stop_codon:yes gene_type:complete
MEKNMSISKQKYNLFEGDELERKEIDSEISEIRGVYMNLEENETIKHLLKKFSKSQLNLMLMRIGEVNFFNKNSINVGTTKYEIDEIKKWYYIDQLVTWLTSPNLKTQL